MGVTINMLGLETDPCPTLPSQRKEPRTFILASSSPRRLQFLKQAGLSPREVIPVDIDEMPLKAEKPVDYVMRLAQAKAAAVAVKHPDAVVLAADTAVACGRRILPKTEDEHTARRCLELLSGRRHCVYTAVCVAAYGRSQCRLVTTQVRFLRLSKAMIEDYIQSGEWRGKAGGYAIQGCAEAFIPWINGSYSNVVGLPLAETVRMLKQVGVNALALPLEGEGSSSKAPAGKGRV